MSGQAPPHARHLIGQRGMTLVEMMIVLAIIGLTAGAAVLALGSSHGNDGQVQARQLVARLQLAADTSMVSDLALGVTIKPDSYAIVEQNGDTGTWQATSVAGLSGMQVLPAGTTLTSDAHTPVLPLNADTGSQGFALALTNAQSHYMITFDGTNARLAKGGQP